MGRWSAQRDAEIRGEGENICFEVLELALPQMKLGSNLALPHVGVDVDIDNI